MATQIIDGTPRTKGKWSGIGDIMKLLNSKYGKVALGWRTTLLMGVVITLFVVFLVIILELYNSCLIRWSFVSW